MSLAELCVKRPVFAVMLIMFLVVLGIFSFRDLGVDLFPKADPASVSISVRLPGATPEEMITQVVLPIEDALSTISGMDELQVRTNEGSANITCRFVLERDLESAAQDVREKVAGAMRRLPPGILPPVIQKADPDSDPVMSIIVSSDRNLRETTEIADKKIRRALETVDGIGEVSLTGGRARQIHVLVDAEKLNAYGITINQVQRAIQNENVEMPGGRIIRGDGETGVRTLGRVDAVSQFGEIIVANVKGAPIRINDIGRVEDSFEEPRTWTVIKDRNGLNKQGVLLEVRRQSGTNTVKIIEEVKRKLGQIEKTLPPGFNLSILRDQSVFIKASVKSLEEHLLLGSLLASLIVLLFIRNIRSVIIASIAIPTSIISTFTLMRYMDFTLNNMTLLALTLAVGIVIDDAIVVLENIYRYIDEKGYEPKQAAIEATKEIALAVMATTLSLVIIFVPIAFMTGYARRFVNEFGWTMAISIMVSMLVSFTLTPMLSSRFLKRRNGASEANSEQERTAPGRSAKQWGFLTIIDRSYDWMLRWALNHRLVFCLICLITFLLTFPLNNMVGRDWIPPDDQNEFQIIVDLPEGTSLEGTIKTVDEIADRASKLEGVLFVNPQILQERVNHSHIYIKLVDATERKVTQFDVADEVRKIAADYPSARSRVLMSTGTGGSGEGFYPIRAIILGPDFNKLTGLAREVAASMKGMPGLVDVDAALNLNNPELQVRVDRQKASDLGVRIADVASAVRLMMSGTDEISTYKEGDEQYPVTLQLLPEQRHNPEMLSRLMIPSSKLGQVRLDNLAAVVRGAGPARIERFNRQFQVSVNAGVASDSSLDVAARSATEAIRKANLPPGYSSRFSGQVKYLDETTRNLILTFLLASIFMYMVLAAQFESFLHPFIIMLSLPLSIPFALFSLWATNRTLNLWSALGVLLLLGIVKKNAILQIDYTNQLRKSGMGLRDAIIQANHVRLRPILMTTFSIIAGLIPTALGIGVGSTQRSAIAVTIIGGQSLCLLLTLLVTPVVYSLFAEMEEARVWSRARSQLSRLRVSAARMFTAFFH